MTPRFSFRHLLMLLYLSSVMPLLLGLGLLVYVEYRAFLIEGHASSMRALVNAVAEQQFPADNPTQPLDLMQTAQVLTDQLRETDFEVAVTDLGSTAIRPTLGSGPWLDSATRATLGGQRGIAHERATTGGVRVFYILPLHDQGGAVRGYVESNFPISVIRPDVQQLTAWLVLTVGGAMMLASLCAPAVAAIATRPLARLAETARRVGQGDLQQRARLSRIAELHAMGTTLNTSLDQIQHMFQAQQQTTERMRRFVADASHELRSPLGVLRSGLEVLTLAQQRGDHTQAAQTSALLQQEIERMRHMVESLLLLARMDRPPAEIGASLSLGDVEPLPLLEDVVERGRLLSSGQALRLLWPRVPIPPLRADGAALRQAFNNLVENSLRHTPAGQCITLSVEPVANGCWLIVDDAGVGIAPEHLPHVFERFYRVDDARSREPGGTGLGLAIVRAVVAAHAGQIELESAPGMGTVVAIWLPQAGPTAAHQPVEVVQARVRTSQPPTRQMPVITAQPDQHAPVVRRRRAPLVARERTILLSVALCACVASGLFLLTSLANPHLGESLALRQPTPVPLVRGTPPAVAALPATNAPPVPFAQTPQPFSTASATSFAAAAQLATRQQDEGKAVAVEHDLDDGTSIYTVLLHNLTRVTVDVEQQRITQVRPQPGGGNGRGAENRRVRMGRVVAALARGDVRLGFAEAAAQAAQARGSGVVIEVALEWHDDLELVLYRVELHDGSTIYLRPDTGETVFS